VKGHRGRMPPKGHNHLHDGHCFSEEFGSPDEHQFLRGRGHGHEMTSFTTWVTVMTCHGGGEDTDPQ
jgi:hypothetical protein